MSLDFYLVAYDISNNKRRRKLALILGDYGQRVQKSVFEIWLEADTKKRLLKRLKRLLKTDEDSVRLYRLCENCQRKVEVFGPGEGPQPPHTLII